MSSMNDIDFFMAQAAEEIPAEYRFAHVHIHINASCPNCRESALYLGLRGPQERFSPEIFCYECDGVIVPTSPALDAAYAEIDCLGSDLAHAAAHWLDFDDWASNNDKGGDADG